MIPCYLTGFMGKPGLPSPSLCHFERHRGLWLPAHLTLGKEECEYVQKARSSETSLQIVPRRTLGCWHTHTRARVMCSCGQGAEALLCQRTCRGSADVDGPAGPAAGDTESGGAPPLGRGYTISEEAQTTAGTGPGTGPSAAPQAREGGRTPPPPPCQWDALSTAGRRQAWQSKGRGDITPKPQRLWLRRGPLPRPEQAPETTPQFARAV